MSASSLVWGSPAWSWVAACACRRRCGRSSLELLAHGATPAVKLTCAALKILGLAGLALCLVEPLLSSTRARRGANMFAIVADNSQSMNIHDRDDAGSRGEAVHGLLNSTSGWQKRLSTDFDTRRFAFNAHLRSVDHFVSLTFDGSRSSLNSTLNSLSRRFRGLPLAGIMLVTDGNATDTGEVAWEELPPVYPLVVGRDDSPADISVPRVTVSETNFDAAPVTVRADIRASGVAGQEIVASLIDERGEEVQTQTIASPGDEEPTAVRFQLRPKEKGVSFYRVRVSTSESEAGQGAEATLANNERLAVVDRGGGPYRVLYVCGRPNWEFKFLRRALAEDDQLGLLGLVRIARREPKFAFRSKAGEATNPLFRGFEHPDEESAERYDQPVLIRLGTKDEEELRDGFPKTADELYRYDAVILDDVEAGFFNQDQLALLQNFVGRRGGGLLMLGGPDSFAAGRYDRTPVGSLLPVYVDQQSPNTSQGARYRLALTPEGWLQPWVRTRKRNRKSASGFRQCRRFVSSRPLAISNRLQQCSRKL